VDIESDSPTRAHTAPFRGRAVSHTYGLAVVAGPANGARRLIDEEEIRIGKAATNHLCLADPTVSRFHCVVERAARGLLLRDLGSSNGTQIAGCWVESAYLSPGVPIRLGDTIMKVVAAEAGSSSRATDETPARILGESPQIQKVLALLPRLASSGATVLLEGETGTGKSLLARLLHGIGPRAVGPFIVVDCGALSPTLIESELFGHERGAFTGATDRRIGVFEAAEGGSIFLDEIGELPLDLQPRLLRALEERSIRRLGSTRAIPINVQIIAATNRNLHRLVEQGRFRADLYYRLEALQLTIPPLRDRPIDIPILVEHFCERTRANVHPGVVERMKRDFAAQPWPGNARQLRNAVERSVLLQAWSQDDTCLRPVRPGASGFHMTMEGTDEPAFEDSDRQAFSVPFRVAKEKAIESWERSYLSQLIERAQGNISHASRLVQVDRTHLRELLKRHRLGRDFE